MCRVGSQEDLVLVGGNYLTLNCVVFHMRVALCEVQRQLCQLLLQANAANVHLANCPTSALIGPNWLTVVIHTSSVLELNCWTFVLL